MKAVTRYVADDGKEFGTQDECRVYEETVSFNLLVGMTPEDLHNALSRNDLNLADAIERLGRKIQNKRLDAGGSKRVRKPKVSEPQAA